MICFKFKKIALVSLSSIFFYLINFSVTFADSQVWNFTQYTDYARSEITEITIDPFLASLTLQSFETALSNARAIKISGDYAYITSLDEGFQVLDISDPLNISHLGTLRDTSETSLTGPFFFDIAGDYAYVADLSGSGFQIIDIADPTNPKHVSAIFDDGSVGLAGAAEVAIKGDYAYVTSRDDDGLQVIDISDPEDPVPVAFLQDDGSTELNGASRILIIDDYAYISSQIRSGFQIVDISDPLNPTPVGSLGGINGAFGLAVSGDYAYLGSYVSNNITVIDISDPANPVVATTLASSGPYPLVQPQNLLVDGSYLYVSVATSDRVHVVDISDPLNPTPVASVVDSPTTLLDGSYGFQKNGDYLYVVSLVDDGFQVIDISDPLNPTPVSSFQDQSGGAGGYVGTNPYIENTQPVSHSDSIETFSVGLSQDNEGSVVFQVSNDGGVTWSYWDGYDWKVTTRTDGVETSSARDIDQNVSFFTKGGGEFVWRAYLRSDTTQKVEITFISVAYDSNESSSVDLRLASYNTYLGLGDDGDAKNDAIKKHINRVQPDVLILNEIDDDSRDLLSSGWAEDLGYPYVAHSIGGNSPTFNPSIISKFPILSQREINVPEGTNEFHIKPIFIEVDISSLTTEKQLGIYGIHARPWCFVAPCDPDDPVDSFHRAVEMKRIIDDINDTKESNPDMEIIVAGDHNDGPDIYQPAQFDNDPGTFPGAGLTLGTDLEYPILYSPYPYRQYDLASMTVADAERLDGSTSTIVVGANPALTDPVQIDFISVSENFIINGAEVLHSETDSVEGLTKYNAVLSAGDSAVASDHNLIFADLSLILNNNIQTESRKKSGKRRVIPVFTKNTSPENSQIEDVSVLSDQEVDEKVGCLPYLSQDIKFGAQNNPEEVNRLILFLNEKQGENLTLDGQYDEDDVEAVKRFQNKYRDTILSIWGISEATGYVFKTTRLKINSFYCTKELTCPAFTEYNSFIEDINTQSSEVQRTKELLSRLGYYSGVLDQIFDESLHEALILFQEEFKEVMLKPWNLLGGTGYKYKTTNKFLNHLVGCNVDDMILENGVKINY